MLININRIYKYYNGEPLLKELSFSLNEGEIVGLIGKNGCGKTTLLNIITGKTDFDKTPDGNGEVSVNCRSIGYLAQTDGLNSDLSIFGEMNTVFSHLSEIKLKMDRLSENLDDPESAETYGKLSAYFESCGGYNTDYKIAQVLDGMNFPKNTYDQIVSSLSGGEKTRLALAKLLLEEPELLILDEPTNHLDFRTLMWLENYLETYKGSVIVVSHDRYFLDKVCKRICELENGSITSFRGGYSDYLTQKEQLTNRLLKEYGAQQKEVRRLTEYISKNKVRASTAKMAKSRQHMLDRMVLLEKPSTADKPPRINLGYDIEPTEEVLSVMNCPVTAGSDCGAEKLIESFSLKVRKGDHIAIVGENGVGKTTVLKMIMGIVPHSSGRIIWGNNVKPFYFDQEHTALNPGYTAIETVSQRFPHMANGEIRNLLASVLFHGEDVFKPVSVLSGGEKAKLYFALMSLSRANFLLLDEPTNHIDLVTKEILEEALAGYKGTMILVSHDRYLIQKTADIIVEISPDKVRISGDGFDSYMKSFADAFADEGRTEHESDQKRKTRQKKSAGQYRSKRQRADDAARRNRIRDLENEIEQLEEQIKKTELVISDPECAGNYEKMSENCIILETLRTQLDEKVNEWAELSETSEK